ncbi:termination of G-protein coupled receptor signaling pathway [Tyrophagus putrescentiae]|nr:termination of G-protein coupled receptor signaling pathway [Tyrophagus putrescentiae]
MELEDVLRDEQGLSCFKEFLKTEFSHENLEFWLRCNEFKKMDNKKEMKKCCQEIYNKYIHLKGTHSVNIDHQARKMIEDSLKKPHQNMFDMAMHQIFQLMQSDSFTRFRTSPSFMKIAKCKPLPVNFTMHFPEGYLITVEALPTKSAYTTVKSILARLGITWQDVELHTDNGQINLHKDPHFELNHCNIYVSYLSSLRTYIKLEDIHDLSEDGITIKSIQFAEYGCQKTSSATTKANSLPQSCSSFVIEMPHFAKIRPTKRVAEEINADHHLYANEAKNIDINDLSFSNESATDEFLADIMTSDKSKLNFICTPQKKRKQNEPVEQIAENIYANVPSANEGHYSVPKKPNTPVHKARFVIIDENEYENVMDSQNDLCLKEDISSCKNPATKLVFDERFCDCHHSANVPNLNTLPH